MKKEDKKIKDYIPGGTSLKEFVTTLQLSGESNKKIRHVIVNFMKLIYRDIEDMNKIRDDYQETHSVESSELFDRKIIYIMQQIYDLMATLPLFFEKEESRLYERTLFDILDDLNKEYKQLHSKTMSK